MIPWEHIDEAAVPGGGKLRLCRRGEEFRIQVDGFELMGSRAHGSEEAMADLAMARLAGRPAPRVMVGGLGMGYTLAATLRHLPPGGRVAVAELVPAVVDWNRGPLGHLAGHPLADPRVAVEVGDVGRLIRAAPAAWDAILLDVDNGPNAFARKGNEGLYGTDGLAAIGRALAPGGILAVWSSGSDEPFTARLRRLRFAAVEHRVRSRGGKVGRWHTIWVCARA
jgi:spermidine synthase